MLLSARRTARPISKLRGMDALRNLGLAILPGSNPMTTGWRGVWI
jgi:hypothetical protein